MALLAVLSPAKTMDFHPPPSFAAQQSLLHPPVFAKEADALVDVLKKKSVSQLKDLMKISANLATLNHDRFQTFKQGKELAKATTNAAKTLQEADEKEEVDLKPCLFAFTGAAYKGLDAPSMNAKSLAWADNHVRVLDGLYGALRPCDLVQPYRLEMGTKMETHQGGNLYDFWRDRITSSLLQELRAQQATDDDSLTLVNLASKEYFKAVDVKKLAADGVTVVDIVFREPSGKVVAVHAKPARGAMIRWISDNEVTTTEELKSFNLRNYRLDKKASSDTTLVFHRTSTSISSVASSSKRKTPAKKTRKSAKRTKRT